MHITISALKYFLLANRRLSAAVVISILLMILFTWQVAHGILYNSSKDLAGKQISTSQASGEVLPSILRGPQTTADKSEKGTPAATPKATPNTPAANMAGPSNTSNSSPSSPNGKPSSISLAVPKSGTVLTLSGLNYNLYNDMPAKFQGIFNKPPYVMRKVDYPASLAANSITDGVAALNTALRSTPGQKIVLAQSQGAQVASRWMRQYANDPSAPSSGEITFILSGNPLRSTGGYIIGRHEVGGTIGQPTPTNTKWPIIDVARRYDGWADWVHNQNNQWAVDNANRGKTVFHTSYNQVNLYASTHTIWKNGNTTYVLTKEDALPLWDDNSQYPLSVRTAMKAYIESAYNRPANDPRTTVTPIESSWQNQLREWGVPF
jgi:hypothetical protein